jgi:hypothetical protein
MATINYNAVAAGSATTVLSTELNSLGTGTDSSASSAYDNTPSGTSLGYINAIVEFSGTFAANPATQSSGYLYMTASLDATNFSDVSSTSATLVATFPLRAVTTLQVVTKVIDILPCKVKFFFRDDAGSSLTSSGHTVKIRPFNYASA